MLMVDVNDGADPTTRKDHIYSSISSLLISFSNEILCFMVCVDYFGYICFLNHMLLTVLSVEIPINFRLDLRLI